MQIIKKSFLALLFFSTIFGLGLNADSDMWPKELQLQKHKVIFYQPQPQSFKETSLKAIAAISVETEGVEEPIFGALWFDSEVHVDKSQNRAEISGFKLDKLRFSGEEDSRTQEIEKLIKESMPNWSLDISYQKLLSTIEINTLQKKESKNISTDAPNIIVTQEPSILISIDGEPRLKPIPETKLFKVINTPYTMIMDSKSNYYLNADKDIWYSSTDINKGWKLDKDTPVEVKKQQPKENQKSKTIESKKETIPKIFVATKPTELISCDGKPVFSPMGKTGLMYVSNTESDFFMELSSMKYFLLLAGRWYESKGLNKSWKYIKSTDLPAGFAQIASDSDSSNVLYAVAGTEEAKDAVLDSQIPQTATIDRESARLFVKYDGEPKLKKIDGTSLSYIQNTQTPVIFADKKYYACDKAIWFASKSPHGFWDVATEVPQEIYSIPATSPLYNVTFVRIYKTTDTEVQAGYTSGYTNTYVQNNTIVYGTGYTYDSWYGNYYYPYPSTWGFHMRWSSYYGWGYGMSYGASPFAFAIAGSAVIGAYNHGYRNGYNRGSGAAYRKGYMDSHDRGNRPNRDKLGNKNRPGKGDKLSKGDRSQKLKNRKNIYNSKDNKSRVKDTKKRNGEKFKSPKAENRRNNNVFADRDGNVHRKVDNNWQSRDRSGWDGSRQPNADRRNNLDRNFQSRERGNNFSRGSFSGNRGNFSGGGNRGGFSGGGRGGGGRMGGGGGRRR